LDTSAAPIYISSEKETDEAIVEIRAHPYCGIDTEFEGVDIGSQSCVGNARLHVLSVATPSGPLLPRGFHDATSYVFARDCLSFSSLKEWLEDDTRTKAVHNQPVDSHSIRNCGVQLRGGRNTLAMARWWWPERAKREGFDLDSLGKDFCGAGKTESFDELLGYDDYEVRQHEVTKQRCACGVLGCRKRITGKDGVSHDVKTPELVVAEYRAKVRRHISLFSFSPAHPLWQRYLNYAAWDAVLALWLYELMMRDGARERPYPWQISI
jgi:hypothetical protein